MRKAKKFYNDHKFIGISIIAVALILFSCLFVSFARYAMNIISNHFFMTQNFYFSSNKLEEETASYAIEHWSGTSVYEVNITMQNTANLLVRTTKDIKYNVKCEAVATATVAAKDVSCSIGGASSQDRKISKDSTSDSFVVALNYTGERDLVENDSIKVKVTAVSSDPYVKELSGTFEVFVGYYGVTYKIEDKKGQVYLTSLITNAKNFYVAQSQFTYNGTTYNSGEKVSMEDYASFDKDTKKKCASAIITLTWDPTKYRLDTTSTAYMNRDTSFDTINQLEHMDDAYYIKGLRFKMDAESSMGVKFYKININEDKSYPDKTNSTVIEFSDSVVVS